MWASPLYMENGPGGTGAFFAVTTGNDVFALDETTGAVKWMRNIGSSPTGSGAGCGGIHPIGILSTPVIDAASRTMYVAGAIGTSSISGTRSTRCRSTTAREDRLAGRRVDVRVRGA